MADETYDAAVIGAGAGGSAVAWAVSRSGGRVLLIDAGPSYNYLTDYRLHREDWERRLFPEAAPPDESYSFGPMQELDPSFDDLRSWNHLIGRYNPGNRRNAWAYHHVRGIGGSTLHFAGEAHRLHPDSFRMRTLFSVGADWPIAYADLEPYYVKAEQVLGVAGPPLVPDRWRSAPFPLPAHPLSYASSRLAPGFRALGLDLSPNTLAILSEPYDDRPGCNYCANCSRGCPRADKGSADVTFVAQAVRTGRVTLRPLCEVTRLEPGSQDRLAAVHFVNERGAEEVVRPRAIVVACGAIQTPRLLLASVGPHAPQGIANESGLVGRNLLETLSWCSSAIHPERLGSHRGVPVDAISWNCAGPQAIPGVIGGCRFAAGAAQADLLGPIAYATRVVGGWGHQHRAAMRDLFGRAVTVGAMGECLPSEQSFVDLDPQRSDRLGVPLARIHSNLGELELKRLRFMAETIREILKAAGVELLIEEYGTHDTFSSTHVFGTCRMGADPDLSVVDGFGRSHRWRNLFIADASVFPTSGNGEAPSLTIQALAIRTGAAVVKSLSGGVM